MKESFIQPRFEGARFAEHTMPLDVAKDLAAYETLIVELAKKLYLQDHPERQRVPNGFARDFHLHLERVEEGSTIPRLVVVTASALSLGTNDGLHHVQENDYFERARNLVTECIAAPDGHLPDEFPCDLLASFNALGRSLQEGESLTFPGSGANGNGILTPERRKKLVLAANAVYEREVEILGTIGEADWVNSTFRLHTVSGSRVTVSIERGADKIAREYGGRSRHLVTVCGVGSYDAYDRLQKISSVDHIEVQDNFELAQRFEELGALQDGWHDGLGAALPQETLETVSIYMTNGYPESLPLPNLAPTPEGNILMEWDAPSAPSLDIDLNSLTAEFHAFDPEMHDLEQSFNLSNNEAWTELFRHLMQFVSQGGK